MRILTNKLSLQLMHYCYRKCCILIYRLQKVNIAGNSLPLNPCHGSHSGYALQSTHDRDNKLASKLLSGITKEK